MTIWSVRHTELDVACMLQRVVDILDQCSTQPHHLRKVEVETSEVRPFILIMSFKPVQRLENAVLR